MMIHTASKQADADQSASHRMQKQFAAPQGCVACRQVGAYLFDIAVPLVRMTLAYVKLLAIELQASTTEEK